MKKITMILVVVLSLSGCTTYIDPTLDPFPKFPEAEKIAFEAPHGTINQADTTYYYTINPIEIKDEDAPEETVNGALIRHPVFTVDGLIDQNVENVINAKIAAKIEALKSYADFDQLPVRPGFYAAYPESIRQVKGITIYVTPYFNNNNILSLLFSVQIFVSHDINSYQDDFSISDGMTFDLNTGNELVLSDLFVNGSEWEYILNEQILLKSQHRTDPLDWEFTYNDSPYEYLGGFKGINGDVNFVLDEYDGTVNFLFNEQYTEFRNGFSTVQINLPMKTFKDIFAFGQRFTVDKPYLFTQGDPVAKRNYLYPSTVVRENQTIGSIEVYTEITYDDTLSDTFKALRTKLLKKETDYIASIKDPLIKSIYWKFKAYPEGTYMTVTSVMVFETSNHILSGTYSADGNKLTFEDIYANGFDYKARFIAAIKEELDRTASEQDKVYDPEEVFDALAPSLRIYSNYYDRACIVAISNDFIFDAAWDPGYFTFSDLVTDDPDVFKLKPWKFAY